MVSGNDPGQKAFLDALRKHTVSAEVMHCDHYRVKGGVAVRSDYIILVQTKKDSVDSKAPSAFKPFMFSKTYTAFRTFANELKMTAEAVAGAIKKLSPEASKVAKYCELVSHLIESQRVQYVKLTAGHVKNLAKQRTQIINGVLESTCQFFPASTTANDTPSDLFVQEIANKIELFMLTDHCSEEEMLRVFQSSRQMESEKKGVEKNPILNPLAGILGMLDNTNNKGNKSNEGEAKEAEKGEPRARAVSRVAPLTRKDRRSEETREHDKVELDKVGDDPKLVLDDHFQEMASKKKLNWQSNGSFMISKNPYVWLGLVGTALVFLSRAAAIKVHLDADWGLLLLFASYCLGMHTPRAVPEGVVSSATLPDRSGRTLIRRTFIRTGSTRRTSVKSVGSKTGSLAGPVASGETMDVDFTYEEAVEITCQMKEFPKGATLGSVDNCWGHSNASDFQVRGPKYRTDKKKVPSEEFLFPLRAVELYLTDACPANVGKNPALLGGKARDIPTFMINFRLPWGVVVFYYEIPEKFVPYVRACYEPEKVDVKKLEEALKGMSPADRCVSRFLMKNTDHKNKTFKIVPVVVNGPWVVKSIVGGKPALVGQKLPIDYVYEPAKDGKAFYLEADLDIAASSAARGILSVTRTYTAVLTLDLGFVIQGNDEDELPECMLTGCRLHGVNPLTAPSYPTMPSEDEFYHETSDPSDDGSVTPAPPSLSSE